MNKTYASSSVSKGKLRVFCKADGSYELMYSGQLFYEKQRIDIEAVLVGSMAHSKNLKTN
jgi:hypothetical protein